MQSGRATAGRSRLWFEGFSALVISSVAFWSGANWHQEPRWHGRTFHQWADEMTAHPIQNRSAVRQLGPAIVPYLVQEMERVGGLTEATWRFELLCAIHRRAPHFARCYLPEPILQDERRVHALTLLHELGPDAKAALPTLIHLLDSERLRGTVLPILQSMGPAAQPAGPKLMDLLDEPCPFILTTLLEIGTEPDELRKVLVPALTNPVPWFRAEARLVVAHLDGASGPTAADRARSGGERAPKGEVLCNETKLSQRSEAPPR